MFGGAHWIKINRRRCQGSNESCGYSRCGTKKSKLGSLVRKGTFEVVDTTLVSVGQIKASVNSHHKRREGAFGINWSRECSTGVGGS